MGRGAEGQRGSCWDEHGHGACGIYTSRTYGTHGVGETRMELDPGSASHPSHHNHYQSRWEDGEGGQERTREGERTVGVCLNENKEWG